MEIDNREWTNGQQCYYMNTILVHCTAKMKLNGRIISISPICVIYFPINAFVNLADLNKYMEIWV